MIIKNPGLKKGYNPIFKFEDMDWNDPKNMKMKFGILRLDPQEVYSLNEPLEKAVLLLNGKVTLEWTSENDNKTEKAEISRGSIWTDNPWCLSVSKNYTVNITAGGESAELAVMTTKNDTLFSAKLYTPEECVSEERGKGTMRETSTRIVRTIFDDSNAPKANLVLGEDINYPGKWSSYPPHYHEMPEIYYYKFNPEQGFGFSMLGKDAVQVHDGDAVLIFNEDHSQTSAPGYAMYYIWAIRHLEGKRYGEKTKTPVFEPEHLWVTDPANDNKIFPPKK